MLISFYYRYVSKRYNLGVIFLLIVVASLIVYFIVRNSSDTPTPPTTDTGNTTGTYTGVMPCADCPGIDTTLELNTNNTYKMTSVYQTKDVEPLVETGTWSKSKGIPTDSNAEVITLTPSSAQSQPSYYLVENENTVTMLNSEKQPIDSPFNESLQKQPQGS